MCHCLLLYAGDFFGRDFIAKFDLILVFATFTLEKKGGRRGMKSSKLSPINARSSKFWMNLLII